MDFRHGLLEALRNRILQIDAGSTQTHSEKVLLEIRRHAAYALDVDENFVTKTLLPNAASLLSGTLGNDRNLRLAIANSQPVRQFLAAAVIEKMILGEIK